ncbi:hypothetical protein AVEN_79408-1 [Araneus ventricosus]|uniref:Uncharacterized protein n=1 Tax=Araneus ventricosus TaxID=182803 RepID=A0A4Y2R0L7_ARAVE|nr:hypothetical protein AVEN_79408-1 [Araneus ventricosus]
MWSPQEKAQYVAWFIEIKSDIQVQCNFQTQYGREPPSQLTILAWYTSLMETGSVLHKQEAGCPSVSDTNLDKIWRQPSHAVLQNPTKDKTTEAEKKPSSIGRRYEQLKSLAYTESSLDVWESLAVQYFVDAIRDEDMQHSTRLMDAKDLKSALAYSMKYEAARTVSKTSRYVRSIEIEDNNIRERDDKFVSLYNRLEKLINSSVAGKRNTSRRNLNVTCWRRNKKGNVQRECQTITSKQEN